MICLMSLLPTKMSAQLTGEKLIEFVSTNATMEDNPKKKNYNITIFSPDNDWKMQLNYYSDSMFGTFGNEDFHLSSDGRNYNYVRNPKNDMVFYSFTDMNVSVVDEGTVYRVKANCLTNNNMRFIVEATIEAPQPKETFEDNLGFARVEENPFYGTYAIYAENDNYKLSYGVVGEDLISNFYRADMLMPELHDKKADKDINIIYATALHTKEGSKTNMTVDLLSEDHILYRLSMYNDTTFNIEIKREENIIITGGNLQDVTEMYGCFLFSGANPQYQLGVAVRPESVEGGKVEWTRDDLIMQYTRLYLVEQDDYVVIYDINAVMEKTDKALILKADITSMDGTLYHITMLVEQEGYMPEPNKTVNIDFGHVKMLDFTKGIGIIGLGAVLPGKYQLRAYLNTSKFEGDFTSSDFVMDMCDIMVVSGSTYVFHDAKYVNAKMEKQEERILVTLDMYGIDDVLYHTTMYIDPLNCLQEECFYPISYMNGISMMAIREGDDEYGEYTLQLQNLENTFDENDNIIGDGYYFSFYLGHSGKALGGNYGYSDGTLAEDEYHGFYEKGCEVRVAPVAGTLQLKPMQQVAVDLGPMMLNTYLYAISFQFVGQNGTIYHGDGGNVLLCIDEEGTPLNITEEVAQAIDKTLAEQGYHVRKVLRDGQIIIERQDGKTYDMRGMELKLAK